MEDIAKDWAGRVMAEPAWNVTYVGPFLGSESGPFMVRWHKHRTAIGKPGEKKSDDKYRTASEKIASDLGYLLGLPVTPCVLWDQGENTPPDKERYVSLSQWASPAADHWGIHGPAIVGDNALKNEAIRVFSAMKAFDAWLAGADRKDEHVLTDVTASGELVLGFFDFAYFMNWKDVPAPETYITWNPVGEDVQVIEEVAEKIEQFPPDEIDRIVTRIPDDYFKDPNQKTVIAENLKHRSTKIADILGLAKNSTDEEK